MEFNDAIENILRKIGSGYMFDTHFVIEQIIKHHSDEYINFVAQYANTDMSTFTAHGNIGKEINKFNSNLVELQKQESWSENIHGNPSNCALWLRI